MVPHRKRVLYEDFFKSSNRWNHKLRFRFGLWQVCIAADFQKDWSLLDLNLLGNKPKPVGTYVPFGFSQKLMLSLWRICQK